MSTGVKSEKKTSKGNKMAAPKKQGLDYFPLDTHIDTKLKFIKAKFGWEGYGIIIGIFQHIYSEGYWCSWDDDEIFLYSSDNNIEHDLLQKVVKEAILRKLFSKELYDEYKILTSNGIQKRYEEIVRRRKNVDIMPEYVIYQDLLGRHDASIMSTSCEHHARKSRQTETETESKRKGKGKGKGKCESKKKAKQNTSYTQDSLEYKIADFFYQQILKNKPDFKKPDFQKWANDADKLLRIDKRSKENILKVIRFTQKDDFEKKNVLSISKLRKRFDQLEMKADEALRVKASSVQSVDSIVQNNEKGKTAFELLEEKMKRLG